MIFAMESIRLTLGRRFGGGWGLGVGGWGCRSFAFLRFLDHRRRTIDRAAVVFTVLVRSSDNHRRIRARERIGRATKKKWERKGRGRNKTKIEKEKKRKKYKTDEFTVDSSSRALNKSSDVETISRFDPNLLSNEEEGERITCFSIPLFLIVCHWFSLSAPNRFSFSHPSFVHLLFSPTACASVRVYINIK